MGMSIASGDLGKKCTTKGIAALTIEKFEACESLIKNLPDFTVFYQFVP